jgi:hypothetical protein
MSAQTPDLDRVLNWSRTDGPFPLDAVGTKRPARPVIAQVGRRSPATPGTAPLAEAKRPAAIETAVPVASLSWAEIGKPDIPTGPSDTASGPDIVCLAEIAAKNVNWLWKLYLAFGMLAMLSGDPGSGKTFIALAIAAGYTVGRTPDGERCEPIDVLYMSVENAPAEVIRPRFDSLGGDAMRFHLLRGTTWKQEGETVQGAISLSDVEILDKALIQTGAKLLIVDPIQSYLGANIDLHRSNETRPVLDGLAKLAEKHGCAILILRHLSKQGGGKAITRGLGSIDLSGAVRSEMLAGSLPDDPESRALVHIKSNLGAYGPSLGYSIGADGKFYWTGKSEITAGQMLESPSTSEDRSAVDDAREWLADFLSDGSKEQPECRKKAAGVGISFATLRRAKDALRVRSHKAAMKGTWFWALPDSSEGAQDVAQGAHSEMLNPFAKLSAFQPAQNSKTAYEGAHISTLDYEEAQEVSVSTLLSTLADKPPGNTEDGRSDESNEFLDVEV